MTRVFLLNNYSMRQALKRFQDGEYPGQHLWGYPKGGSRGDTEWVLPTSIYDVSWMRKGVARAVRNAIVKLVGDPLQQLATWRSAEPGDVVYAADQRSASLLGLAKSLKWFRRPLVVVVHHPPRNRWEHWCLGSADAVLYLTPSIQPRLGSSLPKIRDFRFAPWGPALDSDVYTVTPPADAAYDFVSAGKTNRDYTPLRAAAELGGLSGVIYDGSSKTVFIDGAAHVTRGQYDYVEIIAAMKAARSVVIPICHGETMAGLTEVADAIALDKPVIVNRSTAFPYEIESTGAGRTLANLSVKLLVSTIHDARSQSIGGARTLASTFNMDAYCDVLDSALRDCRTPTEQRR
ncbi:hypothetical protein WDJ51_09095 [Rathayibacter sp. YIM 133350]|uniref:hypothetical protein n=1 Tax=Rathayibacter sp. YIM 133350 TaxID=3131992 RepID=UPI00307F9F9F